MSDIFSTSWTARVYVDLYKIFTQSEALLLSAIHEKLLSSVPICEDGKFWLEINSRYFVNVFNMNNRTVFRCFQQLEDAGVLERKRRFKQNDLLLRINYEHEKLQKLKDDAATGYVLHQGVDYWTGDVEEMVTELLILLEEMPETEETKKTMINLLLLEQHDFYVCKNFFSLKTPHMIYNSVRKFLKLRFVIDESDPEYYIVPEDVKRYDVVYAKLCLCAGSIRPRYSRLTHIKEYEIQYANYRRLIAFCDTFEDSENAFQYYLSFLKGKNIKDPGLMLDKKQVEAYIQKMSN